MRLHRLVLADEGCKSAGVSLELVRVRGVDTTVLVALIGAGGLVLRELIRGLVEITKIKHAGSVVIKGKDGTTLEIPASTPPREVEDWIDRAQNLDPKKIIVRAR